MFLFLLKNIDCGYSLELLHRGSSNKYPQSLCFEQIYGKLSKFLSENFHFLVVKFSVYLNRLFFVMNLLFSYKYLFQSHLFKAQDKIQSLYNWVTNFNMTSFPEDCSVMLTLVMLNKLICHAHF